MSGSLAISVLVSLSDLSGQWTGGNEVELRVGVRDNVVTMTRSDQAHLQYVGVVQNSSFRGEVWKTVNDEFRAERTFEGTLESGVLILDGEKFRKKGPSTDADPSELSSEELYANIIGATAEPDTNIRSTLRLSRFTQIKPSRNALRIFNRGRRLYKRGKYHAALRRMQRAERLGAGPQATRYLGMTLVKLRRPKAARRYLERALRMDPTDEAARLAFASLDKR